MGLTSVGELSQMCKCNISRMIQLSVQHPAQNHVDSIIQEIERKGKCRNDPLEANVIAYMAGSHGSAKFIADLLFDCLFKLFVGIKGSRIAGRLRCLNAIFTALTV